MKIGIVGHGTVGKAVEYGFNSPDNKFVIFDTAQPETSIYDIVDTDVVFICVPTETKDHTLSAYAVLEICNQLAYSFKYKGLVVIKSNLAPGTLDLPQWAEARTRLKLIVNPDFSTDPVRAHRDFVETTMIVLGTDTPEVLEAAKQLYFKSNVIRKWFMEVSINEAILIKLFNSVLLATRAAVVSECREMLGAYSDRDWNEIACMLSHDKRIGYSHMKTPTGFDGELAVLAGTFTRIANFKQLHSSAVGGALVSNTLTKK